MNKKETRKFVVGRLFIIVSLLAVLFVSTINGKGKDTGVAEGKSGHAVPELTVTSSSLATGLFATKQALEQKGKGILCDGLAELGSHVNRVNEAFNCFEKGEEEMKKTEDKYFFISRLVLVFTLLGVLFVYTTNGKGMSNEIADGKVGRSSPELSVTSSSTATGMFAPNQIVELTEKYPVATTIAGQNNFVNRINEALICFGEGEEEMKRTENKYFFISRLVLIFSLLIVLFVHAMNGDNVGNTIAEKSKMPNSSEMSMSGSVSTGIFTVKQYHIN